MPSPARDLAIVIGASVALFVVYGSLQLLDKPATKGNRLVPAPPVVTAQAPPATAPTPPAATPPLSTEPVAAGPAPKETAPPQAIVSKALPKPRKARHRVRPRAPAKPPETCVGPLCGLLASKR